MLATYEYQGKCKVEMHFIWKFDICIVLLLIPLHPNDAFGI